MNNQKSLDDLRHTAAHLLAAAVKQLWPGTHNAIGPSIENGFYQDFDFGDIKISEDDLVKIEKKMKEIVSGWSHFEFDEVTPEEAKKLFKDNPYKLELIEEFAQDGQKLLTNNPGNFLDLCKMGHIENPSKELRNFKLLSLAGAYWRGDEKNKMLTRIYGTAFPTKEELEAHLIMLEEAKKRDHKKLGKELGLFTFSDLVGKGLPLWTPKGAIIRRELERFIVDEEIKRGYQHVYTPDIAKVDLYKTSGHYPYYKDNMYAPIKIEDEEFILRPMTCPHHFELYKSEPHSYKELPLKIAELAKLYRFEKSGELMGLLRVRSFCLADAHIISQKEKAEDVISEVLDLIEYCAETFGFIKNKEYWYRLSLGDRTDEKKYFKDDASWDYAENVLRKVVAQRDVNSIEAQGEAAFYGPKIDVQMKNVHGKEDTAFTVQFDFVMPKRFELTYTDESGHQVEPIVIHRSSVGAIERIIAFLIEKYAGAFPTWLAPVQVALLPISEKFTDLALKMKKEFDEEGIRSHVDSDDKPIGAKIRSNTLQKVPYMCIIGQKEHDVSVDSKAGKTYHVSVRSREGQDLGLLELPTFISSLKKEIEKRKL
ncbi:MAG: threonine--tRNA ligase [Candidatus Roizmanbacteria bacterium]